MTKKFVPSKPKNKPAEVFEYLYIEEYPPQKLLEKPAEENLESDRGVIVIEIFGE